MNNTDKKHLRHQSNLLDILLNNYHTRKSAIDFLDRDNFHYLVTIPLKSRFHSKVLDIQTKTREFTTILNRKIFTNKELKQKYNKKKKQETKSLHIVPSIENDSHIHFAISRPICHRLKNKNDSEIDTIIRDTIFKIIEKMRLCDLRILNKKDKKTNEVEFFKKIPSSTDQFVVLNYITKQSKLLENIDFNNINLTN